MSRGTGAPLKVTGEYISDYTGGKILTSIIVSNCIMVCVWETLHADWSMCSSYAFPYTVTRPLSSSCDWLLSVQRLTGLQRCPRSFESVFLLHFHCLSFVLVRFIAGVIASTFWWHPVKERTGLQDKSQAIPYYQVCYQWIACLLIVASLFS